MTPKVDVKIRSVKVVVPSQLFSPVEYHSFSTPAYEVEAEIPEGWSVERAIERVHAQLEKTRIEDYDREATGFMERAMQAIAQARAIPIAGSR